MDSSLGFGESQGPVCYALIVPYLAGRYVGQHTWQASVWTHTWKQSREWMHVQKYEFFKSLYVVVFSVC